MKQVPCSEPTNISHDRAKFHHNSNLVVRICAPLIWSTSKVVYQHVPGRTKKCHIRIKSRSTTSGPRSELQIPPSKHKRQEQLHCNLWTTVTTAFHARAITAKPPFYVLAFCTLHDFMHSFYGLAQITTMMCPRSYVIFRLSP